MAKEKMEQRTNNHHSKTQKHPTKMDPRYSSISAIMGWRKKGLTKKAANTIAQDLLLWGQQEDSLELLDFVHLYGMTYRNFKKIANKYPEIDEARTIAKEMIGARRAKLGERRDSGYDPGMIARTLPFYHPVWEELLTRAENLKRELKHGEHERPTNITVVMENYGKE